jgi:predicted metal-dependent hydrolase
MSTKQIEVADIGIINLYKRRNARSIKITILPKGGVRVTIPTWLPYRAGLEYAKSKSDWIKQHQKIDVKLLNGKRIGKYHRLVFNPMERAGIGTQVTGTEVRVSFPVNLSAQSPQVQSKAITACERALRHEALQLLPQRLDQLAANHNYDYSGVSIKKLKSRWGSCNHEQHISLNLFLMLLPWQLIDYVLVHELNHTKHLNHSQAFWREMEVNLPNAKVLRRQLRLYQPTL